MKKNKILENRRACISKETQEAVDLSFEIVDRIHQILESKGISQKDFADLLGKKESEISRWMRGTHNFTISTIVKIELALKCKILSVNKSVELSSLINASPLIVPILSSPGTILSGHSHSTQYNYLTKYSLNDTIKFN